jgi:hypothetical protein
MIAIRHQGTATTLLITAMLLIGACSRSPQPTETTVDNKTSTAPSAAAAKQEKETLVRFINATSSSKDVYYRDMAAFTKVPSQTVTPYIGLPGGRQDSRHDLKLYNSANEVGTPLTVNAEGVPQSVGRHYTVLAVNRDSKPTLTVIPDELKEPVPGKTKVRLIHAAPGIDKLDIFRAGEEEGIFSGQSFAHITEYKEIEPATIELTVRKRGSETDVLKLKDVKLEPNKLYTFVLLGGEGKPLACKVIEDELLPAETLEAR